MGLTAYPELRFRQVRVPIGVGSVVLCYESVRGLQAAEVMELDAAGRVKRVLAHYR